MHKRAPFFHPRPQTFSTRKLKAKHPFFGLIVVNGTFRRIPPRVVTRLLTRPDRINFGKVYNKFLSANAHLSTYRLCLPKVLYSGAFAGRLKFGRFLFEISGESGPRDGGGGGAGATNGYFVPVEGLGLSFSMPLHSLLSSTTLPKLTTF